MSTENTAVNEEMDIDSFLNEFESKGAALAAPTLPEGKYKANLKAFTTRTSEFVYKKGDRKGEAGIMTTWGCQFALDSAFASQYMKRDNDVVVYADGGNNGSGGCINLKGGNLNTIAVGIGRDQNGAFWGLVGSLLHQVGLAEEVKQDSGEKTYNINRVALDAIYANTKSKLEELNNDADVKRELIPGKLAELQMANLTEFLTGEEDTRKVYLHIARRSNYADASKQDHYVKQILLAAEFEAVQSNIDELVL